MGTATQRVCFERLQTQRVSRRDIDPDLLECRGIIEPTLVIEKDHPQVLSRRRHVRAHAARGLFTGKLHGPTGTLHWLILNSTHEEERVNHASGVLSRVVGE